jgi:hypothetical protein
LTEYLQCRQIKAIYLVLMINGVHSRRGSLVIEYSSGQIRDSYLFGPDDSNVTPPEITLGAYASAFSGWAGIGSVLGAEDISTAPGTGWEPSGWTGGERE